MSYYNTNNEIGDTLIKSIENAISQEEKILEVFRAFPDRVFSAENIMSILDLKCVPLTSIRRAMSNLADALRWGAIEKTDIMVDGVYGKKIHTWKLNAQECFKHRRD